MERLVTVIALAVLTMLASPSVAAAGATSGKATAAKSGCDGARLLSGSLLVDGLSSPLLGTVITTPPAPLDDLVQCVPLRFTTATERTTGRDCPNARVPGAKLRPKVAAKAVRCLIDRERRVRGIPELEARPELKNSAKDHAHRMLSSACFSHQCPGEPDLVARTTAAQYLPCHCTWTVAENLAWGLRAHSTPAAMVEAWMRSPGHRETLLLERLDDVGVAVRDGRPGSRSARGAATYTANFGVKR